MSLLSFSHSWATTTVSESGRFTPDFHFFFIALFECWHRWQFHPDHPIFSSLKGMAADGLTMDNTDYLSSTTNPMKTKGKMDEIERESVLYCIIRVAVVSVIVTVAALASLKLFVLVVVNDDVDEE